MYRAITRGVQITVTPTFSPEQSTPERGRYCWRYEVEIANLSDRTVQLLSREWVITDGVGGVQRVAGQGVVGQQPVLRPGEAFRYVSGCPLAHPTGVMEGFYELELESGERFNAVIPACSLDSPYMKRVLN